MSSDAWLQLARGAADRGEILLAVDLADRGLAHDRENLALQHVAVLALARAGATEIAARRFAAGPLATSQEPDALALGARIAKDLALRATGVERVEGARLAAGAYGAIGGSYPLVNAATLSLVAGAQERAREYADAALEALDTEPPSPWTEVTRAEALMVLARVDEAAAALDRVAESRLEPAAAASAYTQLSLLCRMLGAGQELLAPLRGPGVIHFCGHVIGERFSADDEAAVRSAIDAELDRDPVASGYGALAAGGDILVAEALLDRGAELHVVLPCAQAAFVEGSVRTSGEEWVPRFERCLNEATHVTVVTPSARQLDEGLLTFASEFAMGLALLRARWLHADTRQLAVWDGYATLSAAGTAADVQTWRRRGGRSSIITPPNGHGAAGRAPRLAPAPAPETGRRTLALLFADVAGYSKVHDEALPRFTEAVMEAAAGVLSRHADAVVASNTWGDAVSVAVRGTEEAARIALDLQDTMATLELGEDGASRVAFRLGAHVGPVFLVPNALRGQADIIGEHVNRTARIEPVTPPGEVYVTDAFAAALELAGVEDLACDYVGHLPGAKDIGLMRMHLLRRREHS